MDQQKKKKKLLDPKTLILSANNACKLIAEFLKKK